MHDAKQRKRPLVLGAVAFIFCAQAVMIPILLVAFLLTPSTALITHNGVEVAAGEVRLETIATMLVALAFTAYVGPGLWKGNPIARNVAFGVYAGLPLILFIVLQAWLRFPWLVIYVAIIGWYLYRKSNVRDFFHAHKQD